MVFNRILFVHGALVTREELFKFVEDVLKLEFPEKNDGERDDDYQERCDYVIEEYYGSQIYKSMFLYQYPCCSKLNGKKYIIGQVVQHSSIDDIADTACPLNADMPKVAVERFAKKFGFSNVRIYMMLDDCVYCS
jgi:hypothetical protein